MSDPNPMLIDPARTACLCDVGAPGFRAAVVVDSDGQQHLVVADVDRIGDDTARIDTDCRAAEHEQLGQLPLEFTRRIAIAQRTQRLGDCDER